MVGQEYHQQELQQIAFLFRFPLPATLFLLRRFLATADALS